MKMYLKLNCCAKSMWKELQQQIYSRKQVNFQWKSNISQWLQQKTHEPNRSQAH